MSDIEVFNQSSGFKLNQNSSSYISLSVKLFLLFFLVSPVFSADNVDNTMQLPGMKNSPTSYKQDSISPEFKRIKENGGEVIIDGSLRVLEPSYVKVEDLVEISTPVTPASNHVRLFAIEQGTYTVIKVLFDDGTSKVITNN